jgi:hypothetical protein
MFGKLNDNNELLNRDFILSDNEKQSLFEMLTNLLTLSDKDYDNIIKMDDAQALILLINEQVSGIEEAFLDEYVNILRKTLSYQPDKMINSDKNKVFIDLADLKNALILHQNDDLFYDEEKKEEEKKPNGKRHNSNIDDTDDDEDDQSVEEERTKNEIEKNKEDTDDDDNDDLQVCRL